MKATVFLTLVSFIFCITATAQGFEQYCTFMSAKKGMVTRTSPSLKAGVKDSLFYGDMVLVYEETGKTEKVKYDGKTVTAKWLKVITPAWHLLEDTNYGYLLDIYTAPFLTEIPPGSLYNYYYFSIDSNNFQMGYPYSPTDYFLTKYNHCWKACNCYPYYGKSPAGAYFSNYRKNIDGSPVEKGTEYDTLKSYLEVELIDIKKYIKKAVKNLYAIDTAQVQKNLPDSDYFQSFYLFLTNGDSVLYAEAPGEVHINLDYSGQIHYLNKFLVNYYYEGPAHYLVDKTTGVETQFTSGIPFISPNGKFVVDFYHSWSYESTDGTSLAVSRLDDTLGIVSSILSITFKSWLPAEDGFVPFWVSDTELILKVMPVDNQINTGYNTLKKDDYHYQYIKLKVLKY